MLAAFQRKLQSHKSLESLCTTTSLHGPGTACYLYTQEILLKKWENEFYQWALLNEEPFLRASHVKSGQHKLHYIGCSDCAYKNAAYSQTCLFLF